MKVELRLYASLGKYMPQAESEKKPIVFEIEESTRIKELLEYIKVPLDSVKLIFCNGIRADLEDKLKDGDRLGVFPPVAGG